MSSCSRFHSMRTPQKTLKWCPYFWVIIYIMPLQYSDYTSALHSPSEMLRLEDAKKFWNGKRESSASHSQPVSAFLPGKRKVHNPWNVRPVSVYNTEISSRVSSCLSTVHASVCVWVWGGCSHTIIQERDSSFSKSSHHPCFPYEQDKAQRLAIGHLPYVTHEGRFQPRQLCTQGEFNCLTV